MKNMLSYLKKAFVAGLIGVILWGVSTPAYAADANDYYKNERGQMQTTERYDKIQREKGGMNNFDDVDPRRDTTEADAKAQTLMDTAKRVRAQDADPLESVREAVTNVKDNVGETAKNLKEDADSQLSNVSNKVDAATDRVGNQANRAANRLGESVDETNATFDNRVQRGLNNAGNEVDAATDRVKSKAGRGDYQLK
ncbi:MAG: hypothetical protein WA885_17840 [Phormidesmis sp.]